MAKKRMSTKVNNSSPHLQKRREGEDGGPLCQQQVLPQLQGNCEYIDNSSTIFSCNVRLTIERVELRTDRYVELLHQGGLFRQRDNFKGSKEQIFEETLKPEALG